jgi:hypothetical protein
MDWILGSGLRFGRLVVALAIGLTVIGIAQLHSAPVDVYPLVFCGLRSAMMGAVKRSDT